MSDFGVGGKLGGNCRNSCVVANPDKPGFLIAGWILAEGCTWHRPFSTTSIARRWCDLSGSLRAYPFPASANVSSSIPAGASRTVSRSPFSTTQTGGTITWVSRFLKAHCPNVRIVLADPVDSRLAHLVDSAHPDLDSAYKIEGIGGSAMPAVCDPGVIDQAVRVTDEESFAVTRRLIGDEGLLVGGSTGTAVAAALRVAAQECDGRSSPYSPIRGTATWPRRDSDRHLSMKLVDTRVQAIHSPEMGHVRFRRTA